MNTINYNGHVMKCSANDELHCETPPGMLQKDGSIIWREGFLEEFHSPRFENGICIKCKELPICMGPCGNQIGQEFVCNKMGEDQSIEERIINFVEVSEKDLSNQNA